MIVALVAVGVFTGHSLGDDAPLASVGSPMQAAQPARPHGTAAFIKTYAPLRLPAGVTVDASLPNEFFCLQTSAGRCTRVIGGNGRRYRRGTATLELAVTFTLSPLTNNVIRATLEDNTTLSPAIVHGTIGYRVNGALHGYLWVASATTLVSVTGQFSDDELRAVIDTLVPEPLVLPEQTPRLISYATFDDTGARRPFLFGVAPSANGECVGVVAGQDSDKFATPDPNGFGCDTIDWDGEHRLFATDDGSFAYGAVRGQVARVRLEPAHGTPVTITPGPAKVNGGRAFAFPFDISTVDDYKVVALDASGHALDTWSASASDFVTS